MTELPSGTVTLLFSDLEGSTRLLERLGDRYIDVLAEHRRLLRAAFSRFGGREVGTEGDAFFVVFQRASQAVTAAVAGQRELADQPWPDGAVVRVRMGIHTGEPILVGQDYAGLDVHRAARICSAAHGGQVLLSQATRELVGTDLPSGVGLRDLGEHRLKDLHAPQRLFQVVIPGLPADFPSLRTLGARPTNLPAQLTRFVGRQRELAEVTALLQRQQVRLLTLTGPGGTGKTRLAVRAAAEVQGLFPDGVVFIELAPISDPELVFPTIAQALGVREAADRSMLERVTQHVGDRCLLLLLDNFEQVLTAGPSVVELLAACQRLKVLVTSRAALHVSGEHIYPVPPLSLPSQDHLKLGDVVSSEAVTLFAERAQALDPGFAVTDANAAVLAEICRRLDGLPLAIELAAARSRMLSPQALLVRLERRLQLLQGGARDMPGRQQTLRATIDWSYALLEPGEQTLFARLAVFAGGCTLEAAEAIGNLEGDRDVLTNLEALADKNLLQTRGGTEGESRLLMLETIREYGLERLAERQETDTVARRHADYFLGLVQQAEPELLGSRQGRWYERLEADLDNLRVALTWSITHQEPEATARLAAPIISFWVSRGHVNEGLRWLDAALQDRDGLSPPALAKALFAKAYLLLQTGAHRKQVNILLEESLALFRRLQDTTWTVRAVAVLGQAAMRTHDFDRGLALRTQSVALAREGTDNFNLAMALSNLGLSLLRVDDRDRAQAALEEALALYRALNDPEGIALALYGLAMLALGPGDHSRATSLLQEALTLVRKVGHLLDTGSYLADLGIVALHQGDAARAASLLEEGLMLARQVEDDLLVAECLWGWAAVAAAQREPARAVCLWAAASVRDYALAVPPVAVRPLEEQLLSPVRQQLGWDAFRAEWARGQAMDLEDAIVLAVTN